MNVPTEFQVLPQGAGKAPVTVNIKSPSGRTVLPMVEEIPEGSNVTFIPREEGPHSVHVSYGGVEIPRSPFKTTSYKPVEEVKPVEEKPVEAPRQAPPQRAQVQSQQAPKPAPPQSNAGKVKAYGDGLYRGITTKPAEFTIDTREAGPGALGLTIEGPIEAKMEARDMGDGTCQVTYYPTEAGDYKINIFYCNEPINGSPYTAKIEPGVVLDLSDVTAYGPGLQPNGMNKKLMHLESGWLTGYQHGYQTPIPLFLLLSDDVTLSCCSVLMHASSMAMPLSAMLHAALYIP